jgi:hypothetical protein
MYPTFWVFWYSEIPKEIVFYFRILSYKLLDFFSITIILRTFFAPWKRDVVFLRNAPLNERIYVWFLNQISCLVGAFLRSCLLLAYSVAFLLGVIAFTLVMLFWLLFPVVLVGLIALGFYYVLKGGGNGI